jgi:outer membrane protein assembly factor BamB
MYSGRAFYLMNCENNDLVLGANNVEAVRIKNTSQVNFRGANSIGEVNFKLGNDQLFALSLGANGSLTGSIGLCAFNANASAYAPLSLLGSSININSVTTIQGGLTVNSGTVTAGGFACRAGNAGVTSGNSFNINHTTGQQLWIDNTNMGTISVTSDYRIKKNIKPQKTPALKRIAELRPVTYEFADFGELFHADGKKREGFIAHEVAEVIPSAVDGEKDAENQIQSLRLDALCSVMVKAIQELQAEVADLRAQVASGK